MSKMILHYIFLFIILVLVQVVICNNISVMGLAIPFIFIYFIISIPLSVPVNWLLTLSFLLGLVVDIFGDTPGMNALACVTLAFVRRPVLSLYLSRGDEDYLSTLPSIGTFGFSLYARFTFTLVFVFCTLLFFIESFSLFNPAQLIGKIVMSTIFTFILILGIDSLLGRKREKRL